MNCQLEAVFSREREPAQLYMLNFETYMPVKGAEWQQEKQQSSGGDKVGTGPSGWVGFLEAGR